MIRSIASDDLLRSARDAAGTANVREAVRELTLHALQGRLLTAAHIAKVARTVGEGIASSDVVPVAPVREAYHGAWAGLEEAVARALFAVELAAAQFVDAHARLSQEESDREQAELARMERTLAEAWNGGRALPGVLNTRVAAIATLLRRSIEEPGETASVTGRDLALVASGVLVGLGDRASRRPGGPVA